MRKLISLAAAAHLVLTPAVALAMGPAEEMTQQMEEWIRYERPAFNPVEVQVDGATLTLLDATIESHPMEEETTIVKVTMGAHRGEHRAEVSRAVLRDRNGASYPAAHVQAHPVTALKDRGFKVYAFRLPEVDREALKSLEVTVNGANGGAGPASTQVELAVGEQVKISDLDDATFSAFAAFTFLTAFIIAAAADI